MRTPRRTSLAALALVALLASLLTAPNVAAAKDPGDFTLRPGANQLYVLGATPGETLDLLDDEGDVVQSGTVDQAGSLAWRELDAGEYSVAGEAVTVPDFEDPAPDQSWSLGPGPERSGAADPQPAREPTAGRHTDGGSCATFRMTSCRESSIGHKPQLRGLQICGW
jgi:hypothetical protein